MDEKTIAYIASGAIALLLPFLKAAGEKVAEEAGKQSINSAKSLYKIIKNKFSSKKTAKKALSDFEKNPMDEELEIVFRLQLKKLLRNDREFAEAVVKLLDESNSPFLSNIVSDSGGIATQGSVAAGKGGIAIKGDVHGDVRIDN